jgi:hypothetical protein
MRTALALQAVAEELATAPPDRLLETLAAARIETSAEAMGNAKGRAEKVHQALVDINSQNLLTGLLQIKDERHERAEAILAELREGLTRDELAVGLQEVMQQSARQATQLLLAPPPPVKKPDPDPVVPGWKAVQQETREIEDPKAAEALFRELAERLREPGETRLRLTWTLERRTGAS